MKLKETLKKSTLPMFMIFMATGYVLTSLVNNFFRSISLPGTCILYFLTLFNFSYIYHGTIDTVWIHHYNNLFVTGTLRTINDFLYVSILFLSLKMFVQK